MSIQRKKIINRNCYLEEIANLISNMLEAYSKK